MTKNRDTASTVSDMLTSTDSQLMSAMGGQSIEVEDTTVVAEAFVPTVPPITEEPTQSPSRDDSDEKAKGKYKREERKIYIYIFMILI